MKPKILLLSLLLLTQHISVFSQWKWKNPLPQGNYLFSGWFLNQDTGFVAGEAGTIMKTIDGGDTWSIMNLTGLSRYTSFQGICFPDNSTGYAVDYLGQIYKTTDLGNSWDLIYTEDSEYLYGIYFTDSQNGIVVGDESYVLHTSDGGVTWYQVNISGPLILFKSVWFPTSQSGYIVGNHGMIQHSSDAGNSWAIQNSGTTSDLTSVNFPTPLIGYAVGNDGVILKTTDGGNNWILHQNPDSINFYTISTMNADTLIVTGMQYLPGYLQYRILRSTDGGNTWTNITTSIINFNPRFIFGLSDGTVYSGGWLGSIFKSIDFGITWTSLHEYLTYNSITSIDFPSANIGYAAVGGYYSTQGMILKTIDAGDTWFIQYSSFSTNPFFNAIKFTSDDWGCVGGMGIYNTFDGGSSWTQRYTTDWYHQIRFLAFTYPPFGIAVGDSGMILRTTDLGQSWTEVVSGTKAPLNSVYFTNPNTGYIAGKGVLLKTTNTGITWTIITGDFIMNGICFKTPDTGFAVGMTNTTYQGVILKTSDEGATWTDITPPSATSRLNSIDFYDADTGYIAGGILDITSIVLKTTDGGDSWIPEKIPSNHPLYSLCISSDYNIFTGGYFGFLFGTSNGGYTGVKEPTIIENKSFLECYPNPFQGSTTIRYKLDYLAQVKLIVYNFQGNQIKTLVDLLQNPGEYTIPFSGEDLPDGVYFYKLSINDKIETKKMILIK